MFGVPSVHFTPEHLVPFFLAWLFNIPLPFSRMFDRTAPGRLFDQTLEGDPKMPSTFVQGRWAFLNPIRNFVLATFVWRTYSVFDLGKTFPRGVYLVFAEGNVMPRQIFTRFIAVKHGREACRFAVVASDGLEIPFTVVARGSKNEVINAFYRVMGEEMSRRGFRGDELGRELNEIHGPDFMTFI